MESNMKRLAATTLVLTLVLSWLGLSGCVSSGSTANPEAEALRWQASMQFWQNAVAVLEADLQAAPPGPRRDQLIRKLQEARWYAKLFLDLWVIASGHSPTTQPAAVAGGTVSP